MEWCTLLYACYISTTKENVLSEAHERLGAEPAQPSEVLRNPVHPERTPKSGLPKEAQICSVRGIFGQDSAV